MTGKERVLARIRHEQPDHLPLMPITMMFAAEVAGVARETADLGGAIEWFDDQPPAVIESRAVLHEKSVLDGLPLPDPLAPGSRMKDRVDGVALLAREAGDELIVEGWVEGPCALAADLRGLNTLMLDFIDDPPFVEALFDYCVRLEVQFARAQVEAGATLMGIGDAAASLIGPRLYHQFVLPYEQKLIAAIREMGVPVRLHICGNTRKIAKGMGETGADIVDLDFLTPMDEARAAMPEPQVLLGNIDPVRVLRDGTPEQVEAALDACFRAAEPSYIAGPGCETPRGTPFENMEAMARFARSRP
jgi:MtaA/CmuA family methyltransferase